jgi:hypothetical protein
MADTPTAPTRAALDELLRTIEEVDADYLGALSGEELAVGHRALMHLLGAGLDLFFDTDAREPSFRRAHWADRKFFGDNADCIYYVAPVDPAFEYRIRGNIAGAAYTSFAVDGGGIDERYPPARIISSVHDGDFEVAADGSFEIVVSATEQSRNWLRLEPDAASISTRHYFEQVEPVAADPLVHIPLDIKVIGPAPTRPTAGETVARDIRRLDTFVRGLTIGTGRRPGAPPPDGTPPPNHFNAPTEWKPGGYGAVDIVNMMTRYELASDAALVIEGRFPPCRWAGIALWNRYLQTLDYRHHRVSLNRAQLALEPDGSFRAVVSERDPGVPNWIETTGDNTGTIFVRVILPEAAVTPLTTRVIEV